jgi:hypothetical protein
MRFAAGSLKQFGFYTRSKIEDNKCENDRL